MFTLFERCLYLYCTLFSRLKQCIKVILTMNNLNSEARENEAGATQILGGLLYNIQVLWVNLFVYT